MYLLSVLSSDRTAEITFLLSLNSSYSTLPSSLPSIAVSNIHRTALAHHTHRFYNPTYAGLITSLTAENSKSTQVKENVPKSKDQPPQPNNQDEAAGTLRSQYGRFLPPPPTSPPSRHAYLSTLEEVLGKYYNEEKDGGVIPSSEDEVNWVYLATPFVCCYARPVAVFLAFQKLMKRISTTLPCRSMLADDRILPTNARSLIVATYSLSPGPTGTIRLFRR